MSKSLTCTVYRHEILISVGIFVVLAAGLFGSGYWLGHRGMPELQANYEAAHDTASNLFALASAEGWTGDENTLRVNAECRGDASDWATVRMANEIAAKYDIPFYAHGDCQMHSIVDFTTEKISGCRNEGDHMVCYKEGEIVYVPAVSSQ